MRVSEVLRKAATAEFLWDGESVNDIPERLSCVAVFMACGRDYPLRERTKDFMREFGYPAGMSFWEFLIDSERQAARKATLLFAADIAEEWEV